MRPLIRERRFLLTRLTPDAARARLREQIQAGFGFTRPHRKPLQGWVSDERFEIGKAVAYRNPYQTVARGGFVAAENGTVVVVNFGLSAFIFIFIVICLVILLIIGAIAIDQMVNQTLTVAFAAAFMAFFAICGGLVGLGPWLARGEADFIVGVLRATLEAEEIAPGSPDRAHAIHEADTLFHRISLAKLALVALLGLAPGLALGGFILGPSLVRNYQLTTNGAQVEGRVTKKDPLNHRTVDYSYSVGGRSYSGAGGAGKGAPPFEAIGVGQEVRVTYLRDAPEVSVLGDADGRLKEDIQTIALASVTLDLLFLAGNWHRIGAYVRRV